MKPDQLGPPAPLCGHGSKSLMTQSYRGLCTQCGSFWDLEVLGDPFTYDSGYPADRQHFDPQVGSLKQKALQNWIEKVGLRLSDKKVCEVGFGGAFCLRWLKDRSLSVCGIEVTQAHLNHARALGLEEDELLIFDALPEDLDTKVGLWIFSDSFEHLPHPQKFCQWLCRNSSLEAQILLVAPEAGSKSDRLMGRWWPHKLTDHQFHWSRAGLVEFLGRFGFSCSNEFFPSKFVKPSMVFSHLAHKWGQPWLRKWTEPIVPDWSASFNFGQMGLLFERRKT